MRYTEFSNGLQHFKATVRVSSGGNSMSVTTLVTAESLPQAQFLVRHLYGKGALVSLVRVPLP